MPSLLGPVRVGYGDITAPVGVCLACSQVEAMELMELGRVLPVEKWWVND